MSIPAARASFNTFSSDSGEPDDSGEPPPTGSLAAAVRQGLAPNIYADQIRAVLVYHGDRQVLAAYQHSGPRTYRNVDALTTTVLSALGVVMVLTLAALVAVAYKLGAKVGLR